MYTIVRLLAMLIGLPVFLFAFFKGVFAFFSEKSLEFLKWWAIGFIAAAIGWGLPMFIGMEYDLSDCRTNKLVVGKLVSCDNPGQ